MTVLLAVGMEKCNNNNKSIIGGDYEKLLTSTIHPFYAREKIPPVQLARENRNILWINTSAFSHIFNIHDFCKFFNEETLSSSRVCQDGSVRFYKLKLTENKLQSIIAQYLKKHSCPECKSIFIVDNICVRCKAICPMK